LHRSDLPTRTQTALRGHAPHVHRADRSSGDRFRPAPTAALCVTSFASLLESLAGRWALAQSPRARLAVRAADGGQRPCIDEACVGTLKSACSRPVRRTSTMIHVLLLFDREGTAELRQRVRPEHKAYLGSVADRIAFAGPLLADDGVTMVGSLLAIAFADRGAANAWLADEPFTRAGLYARSEIHPFANLWPQRAGFPPESAAPHRRR
jgi:uncharacterized protein YciI